MIELWRIEYNTDRPNKALRNRTPEEFAKYVADQLTHWSALIKQAGMVAE
jgi:tripartite-type tricarboxylate transporter receptor subunit TctC